MSIPYGENPFSIGNDVCRSGHRYHRAGFHRERFRRRERAGKGVITLVSFCRVHTPCVPASGMERRYLGRVPPDERRTRNAHEALSGSGTEF